MPESGQISVNDRVLLHLSRFATDVPPEEYGPESTQAGIAVGVGMSRTHVPRAVKSLLREGYIAEVTARVSGHERRMNIYAITPEGLRNAERLWAKILQTKLTVRKENSVSEMTGKEIEAVLGHKRAVAAVSRMRDGAVDIEEVRKAPVRRLDDAPALAAFFGRDSELKSMDEFMETEARILVVLGNRGYGTTALARRFVETQDEDDCLWTNLPGIVSGKELEDRIVDFGRSVRKNVRTVRDALGLDNCILVFDDYFQPSDDVVEFFSGLVQGDSEAKIVVTARQETPAYNWFYQKNHVDGGIVKEMRIKGLDEESARQILGNPRIESDALKRIMMMTRGQPMILRMLKEGDIDELKRNTVFTSEEIRYLLFLKEKTQ